MTISRGYTTLLIAAIGGAWLGAGIAGAGWYLLLLGAATLVVAVAREEFLP